MTMIIPSYNIAPTCPNVSLEFPVELRNITNEPRNVNFSTADIKLEDDRQTVYAIEFRLGLPTPSCDGFVPLLEQPGLAPNVPYQFTVRTSSKIPDDATEMIFTVNKAGRIHNARWKFPITR